MKDKSIIRSCKALAERACANFSNRYCLPEDRACHLINTRYPDIHDGAIDCDFFMTAVLPGDKELHKLVLSSLFDSAERPPVHTRACARCGQRYVPASPRQKYCASCGTLMRQQRNREKQRRHRERKREEKATSVSGAMIAKETEPGGDPYRKHQNG